MDKDAAVAVLESLPGVERISCARFQPDDVIVIECEGRLSVEQGARIKADLAGVWPDRKIVVLDSSMKLKVVPASDVDQFEQRSAVAAVEQRIAAGRPEVRTAGDVTQIVGYAAAFNVEAVIANNFRERIMPGAFRDVIGASADVVGAFNHDPNHVLGRTTAGTLRLSEDATGLRYELDVNTSDPSAVGIAARVSRGDVTGSSFRFMVAPDGDEWTRSTRTGELPLRTIHRFSGLRDVGPVTFPAYNESTAEARDRAASLAAAPAPPATAVPETPAAETRASSPAAAVEYATVASGLTTAATALTAAGALIAELIATEPTTDEPGTDPWRAAADLENARLRSLLVLCEQIAGTVCGVSKLVQAKLSDDYDSILYMRSADADRERRLRLARAS